MAKQVATASAHNSVPQNLDEANEIIRQIGEEQRAIQRIETSLSEKLEPLKVQAEAEAKPHREGISQLVAALYAYARANREELTQAGKIKTVTVPRGKFNWRLTPPTVKLLKPVKEVIAILRKLRLTRFIHIKKVVEVDKDALGKEREVAAGIDGISIVQTEQFKVTPAALEITITEEVERLDKVAAA